MDFISIIVPVYNVEHYIRACIGSLLTQTHTNIEIILIDDGSTDRSGFICDEYKELDSRIRVIHKTNGGLASARNAGLEIASGDYIGFVDSDDWIESDMYALLLKNILSASADISVCRWRPSDRKEHLTEASVLLSMKEALHTLKANGKTQYWGPSVWNKLYKKSVIYDVRFENTYSEDVIFTVKCYLKSSKIVFSNAEKYIYNIRFGSITQSGFKHKMMENFAVSETIYNLINARFPGIIPANPARDAQTAIRLIHEIIVRNQQKEFREDYKTLRKFLVQKPLFSSIFKIDSLRWRVSAIVWYFFPNAIYRLMFLTIKSIITTIHKGRN